MPKGELKCVKLTSMESLVTDDCNGDFCRGVLQKEKFVLRQPFSRVKLDGEVVQTN